MNSCILMVELISDPQLRYTADGQIPIAEMQVQFPNLGKDSRPAILKAIAWRDLGQEVSQKYRAGDRIIIEGRLTMNVIERREGFKEKRAELTASKIYSLLELEGQDGGAARVSHGDYASTVSPPGETNPRNSNVVSLESRRPPVDSQGGGGNSELADEDEDFYGEPPAGPSASEEDEGADDYDPIPF
jgi:single-stranded DNA-binding protein